MPRLPFDSEKVYRIAKRIRNLDCRLSEIIQCQKKLRSLATHLEKKIQANPNDERSLMLLSEVLNQLRIKEAKTESLKEKHMNLTFDLECSMGLIDLNEDSDKENSDPEIPIEHKVFYSDLFGRYMVH